MIKTIYYLLFLFLMCEICLFSSGTYAYDLDKDICANETLIEVPVEPFSLPFNERCNVQIYNYTIIATEDSTIIQILVTSSSNDTLNEETDSFRNITVIFFERNKEKNCTWTILPKQDFRNVYYSKSSQVDISFEIFGNWSGHNVVLSPKEIPFKTYYRNSTQDGRNIIKPWSQAEERSYRPNSVYIFRISEAEGSNVMITLEFLDIDEEEGEYLLIGPGSEPFGSSPPLFISSITNSKKYLVNDNAAYIVFVTRSTKRNRKGFQASWKFTGEKIEKPEIIVPDDIRQAVPICIFNITAVENEFQSNEAADWFIDFRRRLANIATEFIKQESNSLDENAEIISEKSVSIFGLSRIIQVNETCQFLNAMVKIYKESGKGAAFTRQELEKIMDSFMESYAQNKDQFQFDKCPSLHRKTKWAEIGYYLIIPVVFCLFLFAWTWKYNPVTEYFAKKRGMKRLSQHQEIHKKYYEEDSTVDNGRTYENAYSTLPKLEVTNVQGRRYTLNTLLENDQSDDEIFNKYRQQQIRRSILAAQGRINHGFELGEKCSEDKETNVQEVELEQKSDHVYESVNASSLQMDEVMDTKL